MQARHHQDVAGLVQQLDCFDADGLAVEAVQRRDIAEAGKDNDQNPGAGHDCTTISSGRKSLFSTDTAGVVAML